MVLNPECSENLESAQQLSRTAGFLPFHQLFQAVARGQPRAVTRLRDFCGRGLAQLVGRFDQIADLGRRVGRRDPCGLVS